MVSIARKNLFKEKTRLIISVSGVAFAVFLIIVIQGLYNGWKERITSYIKNIDASIWVGQAGSSDMFHSTSIIPITLKENLEKISGVKEVNRFLGRQIAFDLKGKKVNTYIVGFDTEKNIAGPVKVAEGKKVPQEGEIIIDRVFTKNKNLKIGDVIKIGDKEFKVVGISEGGNMVIFQFSFISQKEAEPLFQMKGLTNYFLVKTDGDVGKIASNIKEKIPTVEARTKDEFINENQKLVRETFLPIIYVLTIIALIIGISIIGLTIYTATIEKLQEFGVLKAIGASNFQIYRVIFSQALISGILGYFVGVIFSLFAVRIIEYLVPMFVVSIRAKDILIIFGIAVLMSIFASYIPVRRITKIDPARVFRA